jgi:septal ring factor EnvC (AmiA/AmiB activator)
MATEAPAPTIAGPQGYVLPVAGRLVSGFGVSAPGVPVTRGVAVAPRAGAQAVAPAAGRVAFAGPYRGYGQIVIIEHAGGWTSLVTGLSRLDARVGDTLVTGAPLGIAGVGAPIVTLELRRDGEPVNPLQFVG